MKDYWTSDLHFGHANVIKYSNRPYESVEEMDESLINNWNKVVTSDDRIWIVGDFSFHKPDMTRQILRRLNGQKFLIFGNHDKKLRKDKTLLGYFQWAGDYREMYVHDPDVSRRGKQKIIMFHYAMKVWNGSHRGAWQLYGHSHNSLADDPHSLQMDVGVDANDYKPLTYEQIKKVMSKKTFVPVDHHGRDR